MKKYFRAFTLSELLMSVLVISVVMVAMAPVITKRVNDNLNVIGSGGGGGAKRQQGVLFTTNTTGHSSGFDIQCADQGRFNQCSFVIPRGARNINAVIISGGGGGGGTPAASGTSATLSAEKGVGKELTITQFMRNFSITGNSVGGAGGGAAFKKKKRKPTSQADCAKYDAVYIETQTGAGMCMSKYNMGDPNGPPMGPTYDYANTFLPAVGNTTTTANYTLPACYTGQTASSYSETKYQSTVVCNAMASENACYNYHPGGDTEQSWVIVSEPELKAGYSQIKANAALLNICGNSSSMTPYCTSRTSSSYCYSGATDGIYGCHPNTFLAAYGSGDRRVFSDYKCTMTSSGFSCADYNWTHDSAAYAVRCVLPKITEITGAGGGGGAAGHAFQIDKVPDEVIKHCVGGKLRIGGAAVPAAGTTATTSDSKGTDGYKDEIWKYSSFYDFFDTPFTDDNIFMSGLDDGTFADNYKDLSYALFYPAVDNPSTSVDERKLVHWGVSPLNGQPGTGADCTGKTCQPGFGGKEDAVVIFGDTLYGVRCRFFTRTVAPAYYGNNSSNCEDSEAIKVMYGKSGEDGVYYSSAAEMIGSGLLSGGYGYRQNYGRGGYGYEFNSYIQQPVAEYNSYSTGFSGRTLKYVPYGVYNASMTNGYFLDETGASATYGEHIHRGSVSVKYYTYYPVSGGVGGSSGNMIKVNNYPVETGKTMTIYIGKGGVQQKGNSISANATGGKSGFVYDGKEAVTNGGGYGNAGIKSTNSYTAVSVPNIGSIGTSSITIPLQYYELTTGIAGSRPIDVKDSNGYIVSSWGGMGGKSPTGSYGGCGGLFSYSSSLADSIKNDTNTDATCMNSTVQNGFKAQVVIPTDFMTSQDFGQAGAGGGGAGWSYDYYDTTGTGGEGQPGYVYIWWTVEE